MGLVAEHRARLTPASLRCCAGSVCALGSRGRSQELIGSVPTSHRPRSIYARPAQLRLWLSHALGDQAARGGLVPGVSAEGSAGSAEPALPGTARAALRVQQARGHAEDRDQRTALSLLDDAHEWAGSSDDGDAREGLGAYCTDAYIEVKRAECLMMLGRPHRAAQVFESAVPQLPAVYRRDSAAGLVGLAAACLADHQHDQAADALRTALPLAAAVGSARLLSQAVRLAGNLDATHGLQDLVHAVVQGPR